MRDTVAPFLTRLMVRAGVLAGLDRSEFTSVPLAELGDDAIRIPTISHIRLWEVLGGPIRQAGGVGRVLKLWRPGSLGVWDYLFATADTLTDALHAGKEHIAAFADHDDELTIRRDGAGVTVTWHSPYEDHPAFPIIAEFFPGLLIAEASSGAGRPLAPVDVRLQCAAPPRHDHLVEVYGTRRVGFGAEMTSVTFSEADADAALPRADPALAAILEHHARTAVATARPVLGWLDRFHHALDSSVGDAPPDLAQVARRLAMGPRTLQRRLREEGTSWREELERVRRRRTEHLLRETSLSVESIAARVGYSDPRALRRAIHRWYGHGPAAYRAASATRR